MKAVQTYLHLATCSPFDGVALTPASNSCILVFSHYSAKRHKMDYTSKTFQALESRNTRCFDDYRSSLRRVCHQVMWWGVCAILF